MAKVKYTAVVADMRNKLSGTIFSKNRGGAYSKTLVIPTNPNTTAQAAYRAKFGLVSQTWKTLTDLQRLSWEQAVPRWGQTDIFGDVRIPSGFNLFQKLNSQLLRVGSAQITVAPLPVTMPQVTSITCSYVAGGASMNALPVFSSNYGSNYKVAIRVTKPVGLGVKFVKNLYADIMIGTAGQTAPFNIQAAYVAKFGLPGVGVKIGTQAVIINKNTGQISNAMSVITTTT